MNQLQLSVGLLVIVAGFLIYFLYQTSQGYGAAEQVDAETSGDQREGPDEHPEGGKTVDETNAPEDATSTSTEVPADEAVVEDDTSSFFSTIFAVISFERILRSCFALGGIVALIVAVAALWFPASLQEVGFPPIQAAEFELQSMMSGIVQVAVLGFIILYGLWRVFRLQESTQVRHVEPPLATPPEAVSDDAIPNPGHSLDAHLTKLDREGSGSETVSTLREALTGTARAVLVEYGGNAPETADDLLERGEWTDDPRAAAFLGDADQTDPGWITALVDWLHGEPTDRRRARHTIDAIERYADEKVSESS